MSGTESNQEDFGALLDEYEQSDPEAQKNELPAVGDTVQGGVVSIGNDSLFIALGGKAEAVLGLDQVTDENGEVTVAVGDKIEARVAEIRGDQVILRISMGKGPEARNELQVAFENKIPVEGQVTGVIKGGVEVQLAGLRAFCPISQLDNRFVEDPTQFVGQKLQFRIIRYESGRGSHVNIVLSRRVLREEEAAVQAVETRAKLHKGAVLEGTVISIKGYGAFVDLGGIEGMLHISELSFARVEHPNDVVAVGQKLEVQVIKIEKTDNPKRPEKIGLSLKALAKDPWKTAFEELEEGMKLQGKVMRIQPFGAFVEVRPGIEGLVHISQMVTGRRIQSPREVVSEGDDVDVVILTLEPDRRRISLSMSELSRRDEERNLEEYRARSGGGEGEGGGGGGGGGAPGRRGGNRRDGGRGGRREGGRREGGQREGSRREGGQREGSRDDSRDSGRRESNAGNKFGTLGDLLKFKKR